MDIKALLEKILAVLQLVGKYVAMAIDIIGKIIAWLTGQLSKAVRTVFGIK